METKLAAHIYGSQQDGEVLSFLFFQASFILNLVSSENGFRFFPVFAADIAMQCSAVLGGFFFPAMDFIIRTLSSGVHGIPFLPFCAFDIFSLVSSDVTFPVFIRDIFSIVSLVCRRPSIGEMLPPSEML